MGERKNPHEVFLNRGEIMKIITGILKFVFGSIFLLFFLGGILSFFEGESGGERDSNKISARSKKNPSKRSVKPKKVKTTYKAKTNSNKNWCLSARVKIMNNQKLLRNCLRTRCSNYMYTHIEFVSNFSKMLESDMKRYRYRCSA